MKILPLVLLALAPVSAAVVVSAPAVAQTTADCQTMITNLRSTASTVAISGKNADKDRTGLLRSLDAASTELGKGKNADAAKKLEDFKVKVGQLAAAGRISAGDASSLTSGADSAIACINGTSSS